MIKAEAQRCFVMMRCSDRRPPLYICNYYINEASAPNRTIKIFRKIVSYQISLIDCDDGTIEDIIISSHGAIAVARDNNLIIIILNFINCY